MRAVLLFPGQGSQQPGMGKDLHDSSPAAREVFERGSEVLGTSLAHLCFGSSADELRETRNAQLSLFTVGAAAWAAMQERAGFTEVVAAAGHSVGEYAAYHAASALSLDAALRLVDARGASMSQAGRLQPGTMAAVLGVTDPPVEDICRAASTADSVVVPANFNAPEQVVISGHVDAVERATRGAAGAGARKVMQLNVSGAFHSPLMQGALDGLSHALASAEFRDPRIAVYSNVSAEPCSSGAVARDLLGKQLTAPVRWVELVRRIEQDFPGALCLELGPGTVLAGLVKRCAPSLRTVPCATIRDIDAAEALLA